MQPIAITPEPIHTTDQTFASLGFSGPLLQCIRLVGFEHPTPIQAAVIPTALTGRDIVGLAQTGSGKTAAFALPIAERLVQYPNTRALILCPTREIALQTHSFFDELGKEYGLRTACLIGGVKMGPQVQALRRQPHVIISTPGRMFDHLERGTAKIDRFNVVVLDEADRMLDMGFLPQVQRILTRLPRKRQTLMFSATMPPLVERLTEQFMDDPEWIDILPEGRAATGITHRVFLVEPENKKAALLELLRQEAGSTLIFIRRKIDAEWLTGILVRSGHKVERIHSDLSQSERTQALQSFRDGETRILVATDIAARGIDVPHIRHIINYELPESVEDYIHRAGRTARASATGIVSSIGTWLDKPMVKELEDTLGQEIPRASLPGVPEYQEMKPRVSLGARRSSLKVKRR
jgi:ATP-dependent RNA helicase RhlE